MSESTCIALLRGINVSGHKPLKMDAGRASCTALGLEDVRTYIQSGNIVFKAPAMPTDALTQRIHDRILSDFGYEVPVIVMSSAEVGRTISNNPFLQESGLDASRLFVTFLSRVPEKTALKALAALSGEPDRICQVDRAVYLYCLAGFHKTRFGNNTLERVLAVSATTRNWQTVNKLYEISLA